MTPLRFVIVDLDSADFVTDEPLFWSNDDGWVSLETPSVLEATATETERNKLLPLGGRVEWITRANARKLVAEKRRNSEKQKSKISMRERQHRALLSFIETVESTGGVTANLDPVECPAWHDLGEAYVEACSVLGHKPKIKKEKKK